MTGLLVLAGAGIGLLVGSFIGAAAIRLPRGESVVTGRSHCDHCQRRLGMADLMPVLSFLLRRGRCRTCGAAIDPIHLMAELGGAVVGGLAVLAGEGLVEILVSALFGWQLLALALLDARHFWLPLRFVGLLATSAALLPVTAFEEPVARLVLSQIAGGALGFAILAAPAIAYRVLRKREGLGAADPLLLAAIGLWLGPFGVVLTLLLAAAGGLAAALVLHLFGCKVDGQSVLPLGTLMALSAYAVWIVERA